MGRARNAYAIGVHAVSRRAGNASGFQSFQYRKLEFLLGNKNAATVKVFAHDYPIYADLAAPSSFAQPLRRVPSLSRAPRLRHPCGVHRARLVEPHTSQRCHRRDLPRDLRNAKALGGLRDVREARRCRGVLPALALPSSQAVERIIGFRPGTGGSSGAGFLRQALDLTFFPELLASRTEAPRRRLPSHLQLTPHMQASKNEYC